MKAQCFSFQWELEKREHILQMRIWPWICSLEELLWAMTHSCKASGNVLTIPRFYVGGCILLSVRDGYMEMTRYTTLQPDSQLGFGSEEESVTYCRSSPSRWERSTREEWRCQENKRLATAWLERNSWVWQTSSVLVGSDKINRKGGEEKSWKPGVMAKEKELRSRAGVELNKICRG